jgi:DNA-binding XRE family transcriptional regulator
MKPKAVKPNRQNPVKKKYQPPKKVKPKHQMIMSSIGEKLQLLRKSKNLSVSGLAKEIGISRNAYGQIENGKVYCNFLSILQVLDFHHVDAKNFFNQL